MWKANSRKLIWLVSTLDHKLFYERPVVNILSFATGPGSGCREMQQFLTKLYWSLRLKGEKGRHQYYRSCLHLKFWHFGQFVGGILSIKKNASKYHSFISSSLSFWCPLKSRAQGMSLSRFTQSWSCFVNQCSLWHSSVLPVYPESSSKRVSDQR